MSRQARLIRMLKTSGVSRYDLLIFYRSHCCLIWPLRLSNDGHGDVTDPAEFADLGLK